MPRSLWQDPYAEQAANLLQEPNRARAEAVRQVGLANARAAETAGNANANAQIQSGNAWAQGIQQVGGAIASIPGHIQQLQEQSRAAQMQKLQLAGMQRQNDAQQRIEESRQTIGALMSNPDMLNQDGTFNGQAMYKLASSSLPNGASGPVQAPDPDTFFGIIDPINAHISKANQIRQQYEEHKTNTIAQFATSIMKLGGNDPDKLIQNAQLAVAAAVKSKLVTQEEANGIIVPMIENPDAALGILQGIAARSTVKRDKPTEVDVAIAAGAGDPAAVGAMKFLKPGAANQPTEWSLRADLASPDPAVRARAEKALASEPAKPETRNIDVQAAEALAKGDTKRYQELVKAKRDLDTSPTPERAGIWVIRDGKTLRVSESQIRPGDEPASTREQGRRVTSADAGRFAELQTSLDDLGTLTKTLVTDTTKGQVGPDGKRTGLQSQVGAGLWSAVTEFAGWGEGAKERQAVIDRVRQVIGKALEGGVLRKEDEEKYKKILPTIKDPPALAKSKIEGLQVAIQQRLSRELEAREDAGYDVTRFRTRQDTPAAAPKKLRYNPATGKVE